MVDMVMDQCPLCLGQGAFDGVELRGNDLVPYIKGIPPGGMVQGGKSGCHPPLPDHKMGQPALMRRPAVTDLLKMARSLWVTLLLVAALACAPVIEAIKHGPGVMAAEADHRALPATHGHGHDIGRLHRPEFGDHDHVTVALPTDTGTEFLAKSPQTWTILASDTNGTIRDGPRRPPRLTLI